MYPYYEDILSRIDEEPRWFDENGVPRYGEFSPERIASIHCAECALVEIACQACGRLFHVVYSNVNVPFPLTYQEQRDFMNDPANAHLNIRPVADAIREKTPVYGDPPNMRCCSAGNTMTCEEKRVLEYWSRSDRKYVDGCRITDPRYFEWARDHDLEINIEWP